MSRKVTKFVSKRIIQDSSALEKRANDFVARIKTRVKEEKKLVVNSDQSGIQLELSFGRTIAMKGDTFVPGRVQRLNSLTHSYTVMPIMDSDGQLYDPLYVVLQDGVKFGPRVLASMFKHPKLFVTCSKSGKMTNDHMNQFMTEILFKKVPSGSLLLLDTWSGHSKVESLETPEDYEIDFEFIPPGTTGKCQPLDVYYFRIFKTFLKNISNLIKMRSEIVLAQRNNILKLILLAHNQFQSPRYRYIYTCLINYSVL